MSYASLTDNLEQANNQMKMGTNNIASGNVNAALLNLNNAIRTLKSSKNTSPTILANMKNLQNLLDNYKKSGENSSDSLKTLTDWFNKIGNDINNKKEGLNTAENKNQDIMRELADRISNLTNPKSSKDSEPSIVERFGKENIIASTVSPLYLQKRFGRIPIPDYFGAGKMYSPYQYTDSSLSIPSGIDYSDEQIDAYKNYIKENGGKTYISLNDFSICQENNGVGNYTDEQKDKLYQHYCNLPKWFPETPEKRKEKLSREEFDEYFTADGFLTQWDNDLAYLDSEFQSSVKAYSLYDSLIIFDVYEHVNTYEGYKSVVIDKFDLDMEIAEPSLNSTVPPPSILEQVGAVTYNGLLSFGEGVFSAGESVFDAVFSGAGDVAILGTKAYGAITGQDVSSTVKDISKRVIDTVETDNTAELKKEDANLPNSRWAEWNAPDWGKRDSDVMRVIETGGEIAGTAYVAAFTGWGTAGAITGFGEGSEKGLKLDRLSNGGEHSDNALAKSQGYAALSALYNFARYRAMGATQKLAPTNSLVANSAARIGINTGVAGTKVPYNAALDTIFFGGDFETNYNLEGGTKAVVINMAATALVSTVGEVVKDVHSYRQSHEKERLINKSKKAIKVFYEKNGVDPNTKIEGIIKDQTIAELVDETKVNIMPNQEFRQFLRREGLDPNIVDGLCTGDGSIYLPSYADGKFSLSNLIHEILHPTHNMNTYTSWNSETGLDNVPMKGVEEAITEHTAIEIANGVNDSGYKFTVDAISRIKDGLDAKGFDGENLLLKWVTDFDNQGDSMFEILDGIAGEGFASDFANICQDMNCNSASYQEILNKLPNLYDVMQRWEDAIGK